MGSILKRSFRPISFHHTWRRKVRLSIWEKLGQVVESSTSMCVIYSDIIYASPISLENSLPKC